MSSRIAALFALSLAVGCQAEAASTRGTDTADIRERELETQMGSELPLREVSGLSRRGRELVAVGDRSARVVTFEVDDDGEAIHAVSHDLSREVDIGKDGSQWEAVATDGRGRVLVLSETPARIVVFDKDLTHLEHVFELDYRAARELVGAKRESNSQGEGLVLLSNGHVLATLEKDPPAIIEFGPARAHAEGYRAELALRSGEAFAVPSGSRSELVPLAAWTLKGKDLNLVEDISEMALDGDGVIHLLSQSSNRIARIEAALSPDETKIDVKSTFALPRHMSGTEGMVLLADGRPVVARDRDTKSKNAYTLSPLIP